MMTAKRYVPKAIGLLLRLIIILGFVFPFYWMVITSLKTYSETFIFPPTFWPKKLILSNYIKTWNAAPFAIYFKNSIITTFGTILLQIAIMVPAAYAFAKYEFRGKNLLFGIVLVTFMVPVNVTFVPVYLMMSKWGWLTTLLPQIIPHGAYAFGIFFLRQAFKQTPNEIIDSARLDGAGEFRIMFRIMLPMAKAFMFTIILFSFVDLWNAYFWPLVMTNDDSLRTLPVAVSMIKNIEDTINWEILMAGSMIMVLPVILLYAFAGKRIVQAFVYSGIK
jgi:sn-glycerol 3-phosphate transport system permease protein